VVSEAGKGKISGADPLLEDGVYVRIPNGVQPEFSLATVAVCSGSDFSSPREESRIYTSELHLWNRLVIRCT
jgi:hypothetical protein